MTSHNLTTDNTFRACAHCRKELTDPASRECGVGPVCRAKSNDLYAKAISANLPVASAILFSVKTESVPGEAQDRWADSLEAFTRKLTRLQSRNQNLADLNVSGGDFREIVEAIDFVLSFQCSSKLRTDLTKSVEALGYVGLSGVLSGQSSRSKAKVWFENGQLKLQGTASTDGYRAMRRNVPGVRTPRYRGDRNPYIAAAQHAEQFLNIVRKYWPFHDADLDKLKKKANQWVKENGVVETGQTNHREPGAYIKFRADDFTVKFDWKRGHNNTMYNMINRFKEVPKKDRNYDPATRTWSFKLNWYDTIRNCLNGIYNTVEVVETSETTPANLYRSSRSSRTRQRYIPQASLRWRPQASLRWLG